MKQRKMMNSWNEKRKGKRKKHLDFSKLFYLSRIQLKKTGNGIEITSV